METKIQSLLDSISSSRVYDLAQSYFVGMPHHPSHPPFLFSLTKIHGDYVMPNGGSSTSEALTLGGHLGTHMDALCHFSCDGKLYGGHDVASTQSYSAGISKHSIDTVAPIMRRGVLLDIAGQQKIESLPSDFEIMPEHMEAAARGQCTEVRSGDVVLLRTGWGAFFSDASRFESQMRTPGPAEKAARWLSSKGIFAAGSDTISFELVPSRTMPVHVHLLVESGIHIIECLNLEQLAAEHVYEFVFVASPLKIRGGTGSPIRPFALAV
ncbi:MAG TPA: cyclase family protein [Candidatus Angelobacter sp.]|jgi:kynurenine formamidase|nr:cyclase family protein [Candidatus Angelobacter sp.]